ncbi:hypothetical protein FHS39_002570 [Streptomyces olivoverticillatus]|uniref:Bacteriophage T5 Orf172 DNA-binding domain-containing protein n=1 Tax=Streptomyces olivoverticillatus TaxID=66427 RepID=A0A7W7PKS6_9ACTN|nr:GIY-YIG nuclease family protein [Streptomyces olivoverticillatus]MBB4893539.1 hypothetical protein [Streptomyces olivoverticillatus]
MNETLCQALHDDGPCARNATLLTPVRLCDEHKLTVAAAVVQEALAAALRDTLISGRALEPRAALMLAEAQAAPMPTVDPHSVLVYFLANGGRVKIGFTKSIFSRVRSLSLRDDAVLLLLNGGAELERALHAKFAEHRVADSEWFELAPDVVHFVASKRPKHCTGIGARPTRTKTERKTPRQAKQAVLLRRRERVRRLYDELGKRPEWTDIRDALVADKLAPKDISRSSCQRVRDAIEADEPALAALGQPNVRAITGS